MSMLARLAAMGGAAAAATPTFVSSSINRVTTAGNTVTAPTGIQDGDLLIAVGFHVSSGSSVTSVTPPTGFSVINFSTGANVSFVATKIASSESGNYTWTWTGPTPGADNAVAMLVYRNATRVNTIGDAVKVTTSSPTPHSITPTYNGTLCVVFGLEDARDVTTPPSGLTQRAFSGSTSPSVSLAIYDLENQPAATTGLYSLTWSGSASSGSFQFFVTNEPDVTPVFVDNTKTQNTTNSTSLVINKPTGTAEGDLMVAVMAASSNSLTGAWSGDANWTEAADQGATLPSLRVAYKIAGASEASSYTFSYSASIGTAGRLSGCILTYRYASYDTIAGSFVTGANPLVLTSISPTQSQSLLIATGARTSASVTLGTPTSMTARVTDNDANSTSYIVCEQTVAKGSTGTRLMSTGSTSGVSGIMLAIKPTRSLT